MKITLLQQQDYVQVVLTPETDWEKNALNSIPQDGNYVIKRGSFFSECQGGWVREFEDDKSVMFCTKTKKEKSDDISIS